MSEQGQPKTVKVRFQNDGRPGYDTVITDEATGMVISNVTGVEWSAFAQAGREGFIKAEVTLYRPLIDIVAETTVYTKYACPHCGHLSTFEDLVREQEEMKKSYAD